MALNERLGNFAMKGRVTTLFTMIQFWSEPFRHCEPYWRAADRALNEAGDYVYANFLAVTRTASRIAQGVALPDLHDDINQDLAWIQPMGYELCYRIVQMYQKLVATLRGLTPESVRLNDRDFDESAYIAWMKAQNANPTGLACYHGAKVMLHYLYGQWHEAVAAGDACMACEPGVSGMAVIADNGLYYPLALLALGPEMSAEEKAPLYIGQAIYRAGLWAESCPENFLPRSVLLQAELARVENCPDEAMDLYDEAIGAAREQGFPHLVGLAAERAAIFYYQRAHVKLALAYLEEARHAYVQWGAHGKVAYLDEAYASWRPTELGARLAQPTLVSTERIDLMTLVKTSRLLSSEMVPATLIEKIMSELMQNAGAERGCLLLADDQHTLRLRAQGRAGAHGIDVQHLPADIEVCDAVIDYAMRTGAPLVLDDASHTSQYADDPYIHTHAIKSIVCLPIRRQAQTLGVLYLENNMTVGAFAPERVALLDLLSAQVAISLENASLYTYLQTLNASLEEQVEERTSQLRAAQAELMEKAHQAGMAEIATGVLHNVDNILNSIHVSVDLMAN